jgi:predicted nucleic acid-binding protein
MISTYTAVLDANVLFSIRLTSLLMELAMSGLFRPRWSADIHREWMEAVSKSRGIPIAQLSFRRDSMDEAVPDGRVDGYQGLIPALSLPDPNDRHVLAVAIRCHADVIVTFNAADFPETTIGPYGIHTRNPDDFILDIEGVSAGTLIVAARADFEHYKNPPLDPDAYIDGVRIAGAPKTAQSLDKLKVLLTS